MSKFFQSLRPFDHPRCESGKLLEPIYSEHKTIGAHACLFPEGLERGKSGTITVVAYSSKNSLEEVRFQVKLTGHHPIQWLDALSKSDRERTLTGMLDKDRGAKKPFGLKSWESTCSRIFTFERTDEPFSANIATAKVEVRIGKVRCEGRILAEIELLEETKPL